MTPPTASNLSSLPPAVDFNEVVFRWPGAVSACLDIPAFRVAQGESVFLYGPSGSGKSTLLSLVGGVLAPGQGRISVLGRDLGTMAVSARDRFRAGNIGFIFQLFNLIPYLSALDNILLPIRFSRERRVRAGKPAQDEALRLADRLDLDRELLGRAATDLSVGQQQRVAAARALIGRPGLIVADEPTSALDADRQKVFLDLLLAECEASGASLLFVSHDRRLADRFDHVVALGDLSRAPNAEAG